MKKILTLVIASLAVSMSANASFVVEPSVGMQGVSGSTEFSYQYGATKYKYYQQSIPVGLALKYMMPSGLFVGVSGDYFMSGTMTAQTANAFGTDAFTRTIGRVIFGYEGMHGIRVFAGYDLVNNINNTPNSTSASSNDFTSLSNTGFAAGIGWKFHNHIAINASYDVSGTPSSIVAKNSSSTASFSNTTYNNFTDGGIWNVNVSFPFGGSGGGK